MKSRIIFSIVLVVLLAGCKKEATTASPPDTQEKNTQKTKSECYLYEANGSKIELHLYYKPERVIGILKYALAEKDKNEGFLKGNIKNNILIGDYTFQSEGTQSVRQVAFLFKGDKLIEGYGEMTKGGVKFKDVSQIKFTSTMPLSKVECR